MLGAADDLTWVPPGAAEATPTPAPREAVAPTPMITPSPWGQVPTLPPGASGQRPAFATEHGPLPVDLGAAPTPAAAGPAPSPAVRPVRIAQRPQVEVEPKEPVPPREPDTDGAPVPLARWVDGVTPLSVRCPGHERLELGVDSAGRLHVLCREPQLRELAVVTAWAKAHGELIAMACREHRIDPAARIIGHVFAEAPVSVADLHGCDLQLHLLTQVTVEGRQGWYHAPLNAAIQ